MGSQFRSRYIFNLLASKGPMDGIRETVKNVLLRKAKSGQLVVYSPRKFSETVTRFVPSIHSACLPENENIVKQEEICMVERSIKH